MRQGKGGYQTLTTSIKRFGKLVWQDQGNQGRLKADLKEANSKASSGPQGDKLWGPMHFDARL
jgi:hypothetical protein